VSAKSYFASAFAGLVAVSFACCLTGAPEPTFAFAMCACQAAYYLGRLKQQQEGERQKRLYLCPNCHRRFHTEEAMRHQSDSTT